MKKLGLVAAIVAIVVLFNVFDLGNYLTLEYIKQQQSSIDQFYQENSFLTLVVFFVGYVLVTAFSLPGAAVMTLAAGAVFGLLTGLILVSFASSIGATLAFVLSRYLFRDTVQTKFASSIEAINKGIERDGAFYLFALRLVPAFPFFVINLVMGVTKLKVKTFYWVSQLGMLAGTFVFVNAGTQLASIESAAGIFSTEIVLSFILLAILPFIGRKVVNTIQSRKALDGYTKPGKIRYQSGRYRRRFCRFGYRLYCCGRQS